MGKTFALFYCRKYFFTAIKMEVNGLKLYVKYAKILHKQMFGWQTRTQGGFIKKCRRKIGLRGIIAGFVTVGWNTANFGCGIRKQRVRIAARK